MNLLASHKPPRRQRKRAAARVGLSKRRRKRRGPVFSYLRAVRRAYWRELCSSVAPSLIRAFWAVDDAWEAAWEAS